MAARLHTRFVCCFDTCAPPSTQDGAVPGPQKVRIEKLTFTEKPADLPTHASFTPVETSHLPKKYRSHETSGLTAEVSEKGPNEFTFSLE